MEAAEIAGTVVFAISGVFAVADRRLDWFGVLVVGIVTAVGGGTMRDLFLGDTPVFWVDDLYFLYAALGGAVVAIVIARVLAGTPAESARRFESGLELADALGLALFTVVGAAAAYDLGFNSAVAVVMAVLTGVGGGVIRDLLADRTPLILHGEIYATASLGGALVFVLLSETINVSEPVAGTVGALVVLGLRLAGIHREWGLPVLGRAD